MKIDNDGAGNPYVDVGKVIRITFVHQNSREDKNNWAGSHVLRIQAYKNDPQESKALHQGAEFPVKNHKEVCQLLSAISQLVADKMPG